jgi:hypothetical protein
VLFALPVQQVLFQEKEPQLAVIVTVENIRMKLKSQNVKLVTQEHTLPQIQILNGTFVKNVKKVSLNQVQVNPVVMHVKKANTWLQRASTKNARCARWASLLTRQEPLYVSDAIRIDINQILAKKSVRLVLLANTHWEPQVKQFLEQHLA